MLPKSLLSATAMTLLALTADASYINYTTVTGYFLQDDASTTPSSFDYTANNWGLKTQVYDTDAVFDPTGSKTQWQRFENKLASLVASAPVGTSFKLLFLGRHGEGYHNAAETFYGTPAWNCYWSELEGNGTVVWADAKITPNGYNQALIAHNYWISQQSGQKQSLPSSYYVSPLTRCLQTANITFNGLTTGTFSPLIKEKFREGISQHTCDRRSTKTVIHNGFPDYRFEDGFTENDELWRGTEEETSAAEDVRLKGALDSVFSTDINTIISVTSHSGAIASALRVLGHRSFSLNTGAVIPVLVKAVLVNGTAPTSTIVSWDSQATCTVPPVTSLATGGCVCPTATGSSSTTRGSSSATPTSGASTSSSYTNSTSRATSSSSKLTSTSVQLTTSVVYTTQISTVTACPATVTNCPIGKVVTSTIALYTTVCPVSTPAPTSTPAAQLTSTVYTTKVSTITACPATITNCPIGKVVTETSVLYTTVRPATTTTSVPKAASSNAASSKAATTTAVVVSTAAANSNSTKATAAATTTKLAVTNAAALIGGNVVAVLGAALMALFL